MSFLAKSGQNCDLQQHQPWEGKFDAQPRAQQNVWTVGPSWFLVLMLLSIASTSWAAPRNVLLLISDNHCAADMGCYGHPDLTPQTPYLNAKEVAERSPWRLTIERGEPQIGKRTVEKYIWRDPIELYDLAEDPDEVVNLTDKPAYAELGRAMSERLLARLRETDDYWLERYQLPLPGEKVNVALPPPKGYAPPRKK